MKKVTLNHIGASLISEGGGSLCPPPPWLKNNEIKRSIPKCEYLQE